MGWGSINGEQETGSERPSDFKFTVMRQNASIDWQHQGPASTDLLAFFVRFCLISFVASRFRIINERVDGF